MKNWDINESDKRNQAGCPFCLTRVVLPAEEIVVDSFGKAIYKVLYEDGVETLKAKGRFLSLLLDKAPEFKKETKMVNKSCSQEMLTRIAGWINPAFNIADEAARFRTALLEDEGLSEFWANTICNAFAESLKDVRGDPVEAQIPVEKTEMRPSAPLEHPLPVPAPKVNTAPAGVPSEEVKQKSPVTSYSPSPEGTGSLADRLEAFYQAAQKNKSPKENPPEDFLMDGNRLIRYKGNSVAVTIPNGTVSIETGAFSNYTKLVCVSMPDTLEEIKANAFYGCDALSTVHFSKNIKKLGVFSFRQCPNLKSVKIPSETQLEGSVFDHGVSISRYRS